MNPAVTLGVYRRDEEGLDPRSPRALELHNLRKFALHSVLEGDPAFHVTDWGYTDDTVAHEYVEILLGAAATSAFHYAVVPGIKWLGQKLAAKAVDTGLNELVKIVVAKLRPKQDAKQVRDFQIMLPDGTYIRVDPPDGEASITISFADGKVQSLNYTKAGDESAG